MSTTTILNVDRIHTIESTSPLSCGDHVDESQLPAVLVPAEPERPDNAYEKVEVRDRVRGAIESLPARERHADYARRPVPEGSLTDPLALACAKPREPPGALRAGPSCGTTTLCTFAYRRSTTSTRACVCGSFWYVPQKMSNSAGS